MIMGDQSVLRHKFAVIMCMFSMLEINLQCFTNAIKTMQPRLKHFGR
jgi:hypothetical protein